MLLTIFFICVIMINDGGVHAVKMKNKEQICYLIKYSACSICTGL